MHPTEYGIMVKEIIDLLITEDYNGVLGLATDLGFQKAWLEKEPHVKAPTPGLHSCPKRSNQASSDKTFVKLFIIQGTKFVVEAVLATIF